MTASLILKESVDAGLGPFGFRSILEVDTGTFEFDSQSEFAGTSGVVCSGSSDYALFSPDGVTVMIDVRSLLEVRSPEKLLMVVQYKERVELRVQTLNDLKEGKAIDFRDSIFITRPHFEIGQQRSKDGRDVSGQYERLNRTPVVAHAKLGRQTIDYRMYEVVNRFRELP
jgi:hypothetical protein